MTIIVKLVAKYATWLYAICAFGILIYLRAIIVAYRERSQAMFALEREAAASRGYRAAVVIVIILAMGGAIYFVSSVLAPQVEIVAEPTPMPTALLLPTPTPSPGAPVQTLTPTLTPTRRPPPPRPTSILEEITPTPEVIPPGCPNPQARLTYPGVNAVLSGAVQIFGSANIPDFDYYKFEFRQAGSAEWAWLQSYETPVTDGLLGVWNTSALPDGSYGFRLVVVDNTGNHPPPCEITVTIVH
ncbi:MAG: hypothetical protein SVX38_14230 [Chloroflexota bacterium]|nr:hypothetical protein [Chloroflexota bacterium]